MTIVGQAERARPRVEAWCAEEPEGPGRERERARPAVAWTRCKRPGEREPALGGILDVILEAAVDTGGDDCKEPLDLGRPSGLGSFKGLWKCIDLKGDPNIPRSCVKLVN